MEHYLADEGVRYFFIDSHGIRHARPRTPHDVYAPVACLNGVAAFGRDPESSHQVWSSHGGYPGDPDYREYYRDIGPSLPREELITIFPVADLDPSTGFKYHRITGPGEHKEWYHPGRAADKARLHASDFLHKKIEQGRRLATGMKIPPVITAPFDAELFGHWWFEGPQFLEALLRLADQSQSLAMITPSDYLARFPGPVTATPAASTWGARGYNEVWLNDATAWMYPHLYRAAERAGKLEARASERLPPPMRDRLLAQARRELLLAQSSDWPFILNVGRNTDYAEKRVRDHLTRFCWLADALEKGLLDEAKLTALETTDNLFDASLLRGGVSG
jgi:1,4-alpha-glucan branching enzyme